jgi:D-xylose 1-dehydrogenase (NADP+, D-xylono-1,5-lactone-forming)
VSTPQPLRLGLLSTARINRHILAGARSSGRVEVVAVASRELGRAEAYAREHGIARAVGGYDALLADAEVDAVYVSLPNSLHAEWSIRCLEARKHVLCEKPLTRDPGEAEAAFAVAEAAGRVLIEGFMYRHHPQTARVGELVRSGAIGRVRAGYADFTFPLGDPEDIRARPELGGGSLMDVGCYCVSGARTLFGEPERVVGEQALGESGVDMTFHGALRFPDDVVVQFVSSFALPLHQRLELRGEEGSILVEAPWRTDWGGDLVVTHGERVERAPVDPVDSYARQLDNFADAAQGRAAPLLGREDAVGQARTIAALYRAAADGAVATPSPQGS